MQKIMTGRNMLKYLRDKFTSWPKLARLASSDVQCPFDWHLLNNTEEAGFNHSKRTLANNCFSCLYIIRLKY